MPVRFVVLLPVFYAIVGGILWYQYGAGFPGIALWLIVQILLIFVYKWLVSDRSLGLMFQFHTICTGVGMLLLFYILIPWYVQESTALLITELAIMGVGTFLCSVGLFSLLYMIVRKLISDGRISARR